MALKKSLFVLILIISTGIQGHIRGTNSLYFPPLMGDSWESLSIDTLGWNETHLDSLLWFLEDQNSHAFILLKDGKIVIEEYFGDFEQDDPWYWASAGKTVTAFLMGIAQQQELLSIEDTTSHWLGTGWTDCPPDKEEMITIRHQLSMISGLDDSIEDNNCTLDTCLVYLANAGSRWAYHNAPYTLLIDVLEEASGQAINQFSVQNLHQHTGITGLYFQSGYNKVFFSHARSMARFGLLMLAGGQWDGYPVLDDPAYFQDMISTSQEMNEAYGYLWWLNGQSSYMVPNTQHIFEGYICPDAPSDMYAAYGLNGQIINVVPDQDLVFIRMGEDSSLGLFPTVFNNKIWEYLNLIIGLTDNHNEFAGGSGTEADPWQVATPEQLDRLRQYLGNSHEDKHFQQIADIDLAEEPWNEGQGWEPIGTSANAFYGTYDGDGYVINGLFINRLSSNNVGLWGFTGETAYIYNLGLHNATVNGGNYTVGTLVGFNKGTLSGVHATGSVSGGYRVGGLAGENNPGTIADSYAQVEVLANDGRIGGLVGFNVNGTVSGSHATGDVTAGWYVGGLVGRNLNGSIFESYATGNITGSNSVGGLLGDTEGGLVANSYATGAVTGGGAVGGLIGYLWQTQVDQTYAIGNVSGTSWGVGGLIGYRFGGQINNSYWNTVTSGQNTSDGGTGKTTTEMVISETYANWNFPDVWNIHEEITYPYLAWQGEAGSHNYPFQYSLTLVASPETGGSPQAEPDNESYHVGAQIWLEARPNDGYNFLNWSNQQGEEISDLEDFQYEMPPYDTALTANFSEIISTFTLVFTIKDPQGNLIHDAVITLNDVEHDPGEFIFEGLDPGFYQYNISAKDFFDKEGEVEITNHDQEITVVMQPDDTSTNSDSIPFLSIYPNPATDILNLEIHHESAMPLNIYLIDINSGLKVLRKNLLCSGQQNIKISIQDLPAGVYILQLQNRDITYNRRIVVTHVM